MAAPPKNLKKDVKTEQPEDVDEQPEPLQTKDVHQIFRTLSVSGEFMEGYDVYPADVVDDYLGSFLRDGYKLIYVEHVRTVTTVDDVPVGEQMLYILVKE